MSKHHKKVASPKHVDHKPVKVVKAEKSPQDDKQGSESVKMRFKENKYYNDLKVPMFQAGEVYLLEGSEWIQRWVNRGGEIVTDESLAGEVVAVEPVKMEDVPEKSEDSVVAENSGEGMNQ